MGLRETERPTTNRALAALDRVIDSWRQSSVDTPGDSEWSRAHNETVRNCVAELEALSQSEHAREDAALARFAAEVQAEESPPADDVRSVSWAMDSAIAEETGEPPLPWEEMDEEDREHIRRITAGLRDAGWVRVGKPEGDAVEALAQVLCETAGYLWISHQPPGTRCVPVPWGDAPDSLRVHYRAMARAALSVIGGRETALETAAAGVTAAWRDYYERDDGDPIHWTVRVQMLKLCAALSLPPSAAAEAVRELVKAVSAHPHLCSECTCDLCQRVRAALKPFGGEGDVDV